MHSEDTYMFQSPFRVPSESRVRGRLSRTTKEDVFRKWVVKTTLAATYIFDLKNGRKSPSKPARKEICNIFQAVSLLIVAQEAMDLRNRLHRLEI